MNVQPFFKDEVLETVNSINSKKDDVDLLFSLITDTHISDTTRHTLENLTAVDEKVRFSFMVHLGDVINGNIPEKISRWLLKEYIRAYRDSIKAKKIYVSQGNHDGFLADSTTKKIILDRALNENWYADLREFYSDSNVHTPENKPYSYIDIEEHKLRLIILCTQSYNLYPETNEFEKLFGISDDQLEWLENSALNTPDGYSVMLFSHIPPFSDTKNENGKVYISDNESDNYKNCVELLKEYKKRGDVICWFFGHNHGDSHNVIDGINYVGVCSQTPAVPQFWEPIGTFPEHRTQGTFFEDAWDSVLWKKEERKVYLYRFGAGYDRIISY